MFGFTWLGWHFVRGSEKGRLSLQFKLQDSYLFSHVAARPYTPPVRRPK